MNRYTRPKEERMDGGPPKALMIVSALALILAVIGTIVGDMAGYPPEGLSRASANTALLAIGWHMIMGSSDG